MQAEIGVPGRMVTAPGRFGLIFIAIGFPCFLGGAEVVIPPPPLYLSALFSAIYMELNANL